jgi:hypothetical protein
MRTATCGAWRVALASAQHRRPMGNRNVGHARPNLGSFPDVTHDPAQVCC